MKKTAIIILTAAALAAASTPLTASAADSVNVKFSLETYDQAAGKETTVKGDITVTDINKDGKLTGADAMYCAHEKYYPGGAAAGLDDDYIWGVNAGYTESILNPSGVCVYTNSGQPDCKPSERRDTLLDGDSISWTAQYLQYNDYYGITLSGLEDENRNTVLVNHTVKVHVSVTPGLKKNAGKVSVKGLRVWIDGAYTFVDTDENGDAEILVRFPGYQRISVTVPGSTDPEKDTLCWHEILAHEDKAFTTAIVDVYTANTENGRVMNVAQDIYDCDKDGSFTAYDAIYSAISRQRFDGELEFQDGIICGRTGEFVVRVNDSAVKPLAQANQLALPANASVVVRPKDQLEEQYVLAWGDPEDFPHYMKEVSAYSKTEKLFVKHYAAGASEGTAVPFAKIYIDGKDTGMMTNADGTAVISLSGTGTHTVTASKDASGKVKTVGAKYNVMAAEAPATTTAASTTTKAQSTTTTTTAAATTAKAAATTTKAASSTSAASTTKAAVTTAGSVKTGDAMPIAALAIAGLSAAGAAVVCTSKRREK